MTLDPLNAEADAPSRRLDLLLDVPLDVTVELGRTRMSIQDLLALSPGSVIELDKMAGEPLDIVVNGRLIARGEAVVVNDRFGIRITDIVSKSERIARLR
jgi:flagellar motor switch protein FliN/FliY